MDELVSIIVPVYNSEKYLKKCIESVISQAYASLEIILINDGSTDSSGDICEKFSALDSRVRVFHQENKGVSAARNKGIELSTGKYIVFVDSDDYIDKNYISVLYENMSDELDLVISKPEALTPDGKKYKYWPFNNKNALELDTTDLRNMDWRHRHLWMAGVLYRRELIGDIRFNTDYYVGEDLLFYFTVFKGCGRVRYIPDKLYYYALYDESAVHGKFNDRKFTELYAWRDICALYEGHPLYNRFRENLALRACRLYMSMLDSGLYADKRTDELIADIRANLKYGMRIHGYQPIYKLNFICFSILAKPLHRYAYGFQSVFFRLTFKIKELIKALLRKIIGRGK